MTHTLYPSPIGLSRPRQTNGKALALMIVGIASSRCAAAGSVSFPGGVVRARPRHHRPQGNSRGQWRPTAAWRWPGSSRERRGCARPAVPRVRPNRERPRRVLPRHTRTACFARGRSDGFVCVAPIVRSGRRCGRARGARAHGHWSLRRARRWPRPSSRRTIPTSPARSACARCTPPRGCTAPAAAACGRRTPSSHGDVASAMGMNPLSPCRRAATLAACWLRWLYGRGRP